MYPNTPKAWASLSTQTSPANVARVKREQAKVRKIVRTILGQGYTISVFDSEEWAIKRSKDFKAIEAAIYETDEDTLRIRNDAGEAIGTLSLVYGNDAEDLISDYSANDETERLVQLIEA